MEKKEKALCLRYANIGHVLLSLTAARRLKMKFAPTFFFEISPRFGAHVYFVTNFDSFVGPLVGVSIMIFPSQMPPNLLRKLHTS